MLKHNIIRWFRWLKHKRVNFHLLVSRLVHMYTYDELHRSTTHRYEGTEIDDKVKNIKCKKLSTYRLKIHRSYRHYFFKKQAFKLLLEICFKKRWFL